MKKLILVLSLVFPLVAFSQEYAYNEVDYTNANEEVAQEIDGVQLVKQIYAFTDVSDVLALEFDQSQRYQVKIFAMDGTQMMSASVIGSDAAIDIKKLPAGQYFVEVHNGAYRNLIAINKM